MNSQWIKDMESHHNQGYEVCRGRHFQPRRFEQFGRCGEDPGVSQRGQRVQDTTPYRIVLCTCPDMGTAEDLAKRLVASRLAACVNIVSGLVSVYEWKGAVERDSELLLLAKTTAAGYPALERALRQAHPYELPEIICVPIVAGLSGYLQWIEDSVSPSG